VFTHSGVLECCAKPTITLANEGEGLKLVVGNRSFATNTPDCQNRTNVVTERMDADGLDRHPCAFLPPAEHIDMVLLDRIAPEQRIAEKDDVSRIIGEQ
jgi:hypothetical protein